jgi:hypothetical protein
LVATLERERRSIYQAGRVEGHAEGRAEGEQAAQRQMLLQLLQWRFQLAEPDQTSFAQQLARIHDSQHLLALINALLQPISLETFVTQIEKYTPVDNA